MILINNWIYLLATFHNTFREQGTHAWKRNNQAHALKWQAVAHKKKGCFFIPPSSPSPQIPTPSADQEIHRYTNSNKSHSLQKLCFHTPGWSLPPGESSEDSLQKH